MSRSSRVLAALCAAACSAVACGDAGAPAERPARASRHAAAAGAVVAWVNDAPIYAADVSHQLAGDGDRQRALRTALRFELLAQEALRRGLDRAPAVQRMRRRAAANLFVRRAFGERYTAQSIPAPLVQRAYQLNWMQYDRPEMLRMSYFVVVVREDQPADRRSRARGLAERASAALRARRGLLDGEQLGRVVEELVSEARSAGLDAGVKQLAVERLKDGALKPVVDVAFGLRPGQASAPISARAGFYVAYVHEHLPELRRPLAAVEQEIRARILGEARALAFEELVQRLEREHRVRLIPDALGLLAEPRRQQR